MFFILSINIKKNTVTIVGHAKTLEEAITRVQDHAKDYVIAKNEPVLHRGSDEGQVKFTDRVHYYTQDCPEHVHQIDVFRQQTKKVKGYITNSYQEDSHLVRRFAYDEYKGVKGIEEGAEEEAGMTEEEVQAERAARAHALGLRHTNTIGGFPKDVLTSLCESDAYQKHRESSENNNLPPPYKHTIFLDSEELSENEQ